MGFYCVLTKKMGKGQNPISIFFLGVALTLWLKLLLASEFAFTRFKYNFIFNRCFCCNWYRLCSMEYWHYSWQHYHAGGCFLFYPHHFIFTCHVGFTDRAINQLLARYSHGHGGFTYLLAFNKLGGDSFVFQNKLKVDEYLYRTSSNRAGCRFCSNAKFTASFA